MFIGSVGCTYSQTHRAVLTPTTPDIVPATSPSSDAKTSGKADETVKPSDSGTSSPTTAPAAPAPKDPSVSPSDPAPLPPPPVGPGGSDPVVIIKNPTPISSVVDTITLPKAPVLRLVNLPDPVTCEGCSEGADAIHTFRCPAGYAVTGFEIATDSFELLCDSGLGEGCIGGYTDVVGGLRFQCSQLDIEGAHADRTAPAFYTKTETPLFPVEGTEPIWQTVSLAGSVDRVDNKDGCATGSGVATGLFLRSGARLDSFGLFCGTYISTPKVTFILPSDKETYSAEGSLYGGMPGTGGAPHDVKCGTNEVIVGASVSSGDQVDGIFDILCAKVEATY